MVGRKEETKTLLWAICTVAVAGMVFGAASDLPVVDSSKFDFKYEMDVLPTEQDLDNDGYKDFIGGGAWLTLQGNGTARFDMRDNAKYLQSMSPVGQDGCVWRRYAPTAATGYTVEVRMRIISPVQGKTFAAALNLSEGSNCDLMLTFTSGSLIWGNDVTAKIANFATTNAFHTYRVARLPSENHFVLWCDGNLVTNSLGDAMTNTGLNRLLLGAFGTDFRSLAEVDYLRFTKGAYAPPQTMMDSAQFAHKYEMNSLAEGFSPDESTAAWTLMSSDGTATMANGILSADMPQGMMRYWMTAGPMDESVATHSSFTFESRMRAKESWYAGGPTLNFLVGVPGAVCLFNICENSVQWRNGVNMETIHRGDDYTDKMHVFRVTYCAGVFTLWCDGVKIGENLGFFSTGSGNNYARFGTVSTANGGSYEIDYIRWTTDGAFIPFVPPKGTAIMFK